MELTTPLFKLCSSCKEIKKINEFYTRNNYKYSSCCVWCKACATKYQRKRNKNSRKILQEFKYKYLLKHPCVDCGQSNILFLDFDHIDPVSKNFSIGKNSTCTVEILLKEMEKCDVVCVYCHRYRTAKQKNWYILEWMKERNL